MEENMLHGARIIDLDHVKGELQKCQCCLKGSYMVRQFQHYINM